MINKILVVSDTHGNRNLLQRCINISVPFEIIIHCGDGITDLKSVDIPDGTTVFSVAGNTDISYYDENEKIAIETISGKKLLITHGHLHNVKSGLATMLKTAANFGADVVIFGHTHEKHFTTGNPVLFNPGSLSTGSYGIISISENNKWFFEHKIIQNQ